MPTVHLKGRWGATLTLAPLICKTGLSSSPSSPCVVREDMSGGSLPPNRFPFPGALSGATLAGAPWALSLPPHGPPCSWSLGGVPRHL